ncbi:LacI family DNA-binding transcriptional regulator [Microbacterium sp. M3]|uniref:LacI family DNA-binding transcriptional regulator n=1 Tax=Microbacterium arthrosphaerae TaxID=792652 RepID=A0ABU4GYS5_9MICO|nr:MULTISPECIES: LacI family DNA-binding transcriptional regulator [Microbacterium]MDW4571657.1 LacI family DNA-binding transcriptional regulator [Microbacterium arthrosphaerae]MDW7605512.1 LacI family DNA-binding transcriptional regulator [Microbacterium sp. M3]
MAGIADVARAAGVSKSTASRALTGSGYVSASTRTRVRDAATALGYVPTTSAVSLVTGRTQTVGVVMPSLDRWFFAQVLEGVQDALLERQYDLALYGAAPESAARREMFEHFLARKRFDGLIAVGIEPNARELERLVAFGKPVVTVGGDGVGADSVSIDDEAAARIATDHLIGLGHRQIAFLGGDPDGRRTSFGDGRRLDGYRGAMRDAGLAASVRHVPSEVTLPGGYGAAVELLGDRRTRPTALVGVCDEVAVGAVIAARRLGIRVPERLSVVGIDDHAYAEMFSLTTLQQRPHEQGRAAVQLLMWQLDDPAAPARHLSESSPLVVRNSTAPIDDQASAVIGVGPLGTA